MTVYHNVARQAFIDELRSNRSSAYVSVLITMASTKRRLDEEFPPGSKKTVQHRNISERIVGLRMACELILQAECVEIAESERRVKADTARYFAAYQEDAEFEKSRGYV